MLNIVILMFITFGSNSVRAKEPERIVNNKTEAIEEKVELQVLNAPNFPVGYQRGCYCEIGNIVVQKGVIGYKDLLIQRNNKYEKIFSPNNLTIKKVDSGKRILSFSAKNKNIDVKFDCEESKIDTEDCDEGGCGRTVYVCDVEAKSKDGKTKKLYQKQKGKCGC